MTHSQMAVPLAGLPLNLVLISDGSLAFVKTHNFKCIVDQPEDDKKVAAMFDEEDFSIGTERQLAYNVAYRYSEIPCMLQWLLEQNLQLN